MENKYANRRTVGKLQVKKGQYGEFQELQMGAAPVNKDGTANKFYEGALYWVDAKTGKTYEVKRLKVSTPKEGMPGRSAEFGFAAYLNLDLDDQYAAIEQE
jgi:hypothetical protein